MLPAKDNKINLLQKQILQLCSDTSYFIVYMSHSLFSLEKQNHQLQPFLLTYHQDTITFKELMQKYKQQYFPEKSFESLSFSTEQGSQIDPSLSVRQMKQQFLNRHLNNLKLFIIKKDQQIPGDECASLKYFNDHFLAQTESLNIQILLKKQQLLVLNVAPRTNVQKFKKQLIDEILKVYEIALIINDDAWLLDYEQQPFDQQFITLPHKYSKNNYLQLNLKQNLQFKRKFTKNNILTIQCQYLNLTKQIQYSKIINLQLRYVIQKFFINQLLNLEKYEEYCLVVMDKIIKPIDKLYEIRQFFDSKINKPFMIVGNLVPEKVIFYKTILHLTQNKPFDINQAPFLQHQQSFRNECSMMIQKKSEVESYHFFRDKKNIEPIFIYTTDLSYKQNNRQQKIYQGVNLHLREQKFCNKSIEQLDNWKDRYTSSLIRSLIHIKNCNQKVYRGTKKDNIYKQKGGRVIFKQFTSASRKLEVAQKFAHSGYRPTILQMHIKSGKSIENYSIYGNEQAEILLLPYTQFKIIDKRKQKKYILYVLQEIQMKILLPKTIINYILWVDDHNVQADFIFDAANCNIATTILIKLLSNSQLKKWLHDYQQIIKDLQSNIILITNMRRVQQKGITDDEAGVKTIQIMQQYQRIPTFVYIMKVKETIQKFKKHQMNFTNTLISNKMEKVIQFICKHCKKPIEHENLQVNAS